MSIIGTFFVRVKEGGSPHKALNIGEFGSAGMMLIASYFLIKAFIPESVDGLPHGATGVFLATIAGLVSGLAVGKVTEYYTVQVQNKSNQLLTSLKLVQQQILYQG